MKIPYLLATICFAVISNPVIAEDDHYSENKPAKMDSPIPKHDKKKHDIMSKMNPEKRKKMRQMKKEHMQTVENRLANIEELLKQLVEIQKQEAAAR